MSRSLCILFVALSLFGTLLYSSNASAQSELKVGVVDFREALQATEAEGALHELQEEGERRKQDLTDIENKLTELEQVLQDKSDSMTEDELKDTVMEYRQTAIKYRKMVAQLEHDLIEKRDEILGDIHAHMEEIASDLAREKGLDLLLERNAGGVIFHDSAIDLTGELIQRYTRSQQ